MDYLYFYLTFSIIAMLCGKPFTALVLLSGAGIDKLSSVWYFHFTAMDDLQNHQNLFYAVLFLVYTAWFIFLDAFNLKHSAIAVGALALFSGLMTLDATVSPDIETAIYASYPVIIGLLNALIIIAGFCDDKRISFANIDRLHSDSKKNNGAGI